MTECFGRPEGDKLVKGTASLRATLPVSPSGPARETRNMVSDGWSTLFVETSVDDSYVSGRHPLAADVHVVSITGTRGVFLG